MWDALPHDVTILILRTCRLEGASTLIQRRWRSYRVRVLVGRFRMLRYLRVFRDFNPSLDVFLQRARL